MRILTVLTYYRPHTSGLTIYAERLARALVARGHQVTVMTSQFDPATPLEEVVDGVRIVRVPVAFRVSKGVIMPSFGLMATRLVKEHDAIHLHLPQFDAAGVALRGKIFKKPTVTTYHCDIDMPAGLLSRAANLAVHLMNRIAALFTDQFVAYTEDFATHSPYLSANLKKVTVIQPPVVMPESDLKTIDEFKQQHCSGGQYPVIGMATRFASEKGVEILLEALPAVKQKYPEFKVLYAGTYQNVIGEEDYFQRLFPVIEQYQAENQWEFLGNLTSQQMTDFYPNLDVLVVPSLNSTESFGLVQIEAMISGTPCIASALPGVRQPVLRHGMGKIVPIGDADALAKALVEIAEHKSEYIRPAKPIKEMYDPGLVAEKYEELFSKLLNQH